MGPHSELLIEDALWTVLITLTTPTVTWLIVEMALGQLLTILLRPTLPGQELEAIATSRQDSKQPSAERPLQPGLREA